jgi:hypothetical protein
MTHIAYITDDKKHLIFADKVELPTEMTRLYDFPKEIADELEWVRDNGVYGVRTGRLIEELYQHFIGPNTAQPRY